MRTIAYTTVERWPTGHYNPHHNIVVCYKRVKYELENGAGSHDTVRVYREGPRVYVLCVNRGLPYAGLCEFNLDALALDKDVAAEASGEVFVQDESAQDDVLGKDWTDLCDATIARRLMAYLPY